MSALHVNANTFQQYLTENEYVLADFWAPWCPDCTRITAAYDQIAKEHQGRMAVIKVNIDEEKALAAEQKVKAIPTLILYKNGKAVDFIVEPESKALIDAFIQQTLKTDVKVQEAQQYDMVIIGGGPGGYTAALYAARAGLKTVVLEKLSAGGQMALTHQVDNYPGFANGIDGFSLSQEMQKQAERFGAETVIAEVYSVSLEGKLKTVRTNLGEFIGKTVVIATGANPRKLGVAGEQEWTGRGVHYCAACDGMFYKNKTVVVVGGGNTAAGDALLLSRIAKKVIMIHRRDTLRATKVYHEPLMQAENVEFMWNSAVSELVCSDHLEGLKVTNLETNQVTDIACDGVFVSIGRKPATGLFLNLLDMDEERCIVAGESTETSVPGVYAVGDVRTKVLRQIVTAVSDGAMAVAHAEEYIAKLDSEAK